MSRRSKRPAPWERDRYYPPVTVSEASTWRDINDELEQPRKRGLARLLKRKGARHGSH